MDRGHGFLEIERGQQSTWVWRQYVTLDDVLACRRSLDKEVVHDLLASAGPPVPAHAAFRASNLGPALTFLRSRGGPCVVKPAEGTGGGRGVTAGVRSSGDLVLATALAHPHGQRLLIEQQAAGTMYRLLFLASTAIRSASTTSQGSRRSIIARRSTQPTSARLAGSHNGPTSSAGPCRRSARR